MHKQNDQPLEPKPPEPTAGSDAADFEPFIDDDGVETEEAAAAEPEVSPQATRPSRLHDIEDLLERKRLRQLLQDPLAINSEDPF